MDEKLSIQAQEVSSTPVEFKQYPKTERRKGTFLRNAGAVVATAIAMGSGIAGAVNPNSGAQAQRSKEAHKIEPTLVQIENLPGYGIKVNKEQIKRQKEATVKIYFQTEDGVLESCTGVKVSYMGEDGVLTAAHCFKDITGNKWGNLERGTFGMPDASAVNIIGDAKKLGGEYIITTSTDIDGSKKILGRAKGISVSLDRVDVALISVDTSQLGDDFDKIAAIPIEQYLNQSSSHLIGQEAALTGITMSSGNQAVSAKGTYLGEITKDTHRKIKKTNGSFEYIKDGPKQKYSIIAVKATKPQKSPCDRGGSGGMATFADGGIAMPLSLAIDLGYGPDLYMPSRSKDGDPEVARKWLEQNTGVAIPKYRFDQICLYPKLEIVTDLVDGLKAPFSFIK